MKKFEGTPGNWTIKMPKEGGYLAEISGKGWDYFCRVVVKLKGNTSINNEGLANVRLIATAPKLLRENIENLDFLKFIASKSSEINMWSDKIQLLHDRIARTEEAIKEATNQ